VLAARANAALPQSLCPSGCIGKQNAVLRLLVDTARVYFSLFQRIVVNITTFPEAP
jgi:hypothetical protein